MGACGRPPKTGLGYPRRLPGGSNILAERGRVLERYMQHLCAVVSVLALRAMFGLHSRYTLTWSDFFALWSCFICLILYLPIYL